MGQIISGDRQLLSEALGQRAARAAAGLSSLGVGPGDLIALYVRNDFAFFEASFAAGLLGAYPTPVNWHYTESEAQYLFQNSGARAIVIHADLIAGIQAVLPEGVPVLVVATPPEIASAYGIAAAPVPPGMIDWSSWLEGFEPYDKPVTEAPGTIIYTSGTTGQPKGVRRNQPSPEQMALGMRIGAQGFGYANWLSRPDEIICLITGPMYHSAPNSYAGIGARIGATVILEARFDSEEFLALIERYKVTHIHMVPIMFNRLLRLPAEVKTRYDLSSLKFVVHGAAPCPSAVKQAMIEWWGPVINEYYGSTENGLMVTCASAEWLSHPGTVGKALPGVDLRIIDGDGNSLPVGEIGEVAARTAGSADFTYHGDDAKRAESNKGGLIATGDIGYLDADGFLYLCDRAKDMIISGGANIYPAEIEAELHKMPGVADCGVFGIPDEEFGEAICAVVQPMPGCTLTEAEVRAYLRGQMSGYKIPKRVDFHAELPREDSGKIFKRKLREPFWEGLDRRI